MDIICPQCKTEYEFEDAKVTEAGVTVKCTSCNFMFKVRRRAIVETEPVLPLQTGGAPGRPWMIRTEEGQVLTFEELTTLQQWIVERRVSRDDHISRSGETWKRLGDIAELASFFHVVDAAVSAEDASGGHAATGRRRPSTAKHFSVGFAGPPDERHHEVGATNEPEPEAETRQYQPEPRPSQSIQEPRAMGTPMAIDEPAFASATSTAFAAVGPSAAWEEGGGRVSGRHAAVELGEEEFPERHAGRMLGWFVLAVVVLGGGSLAFIYRDRLGSLFKGERPGSGIDDQAYQTGRKLFLRDDEESLRQADLELSRCAAQNGLCEAARAEVLGTWASHLRDEAELLERQARVQERNAGGRRREAASGPDAKALRLKASTLREQADRKLSEAEIHAKRGLERAPGAPEAARAMADYRRITGGEPLLLELKKKLPDDPEAIFIEGAYWSSHGNQDRAESQLKEALTKTRARQGQLLVRAAFAMGMMQLRADRRTEARAQAQSILDVNPKHRWANQLLDVLRTEEQTPVAKEVTKAASAPDAGPAAASPPTPPTPPSGGSGSAPPSGASAKGGKGRGGSVGPEPPASATYEQLVSHGAALSEKGRTMQALKVFERALKLRPNGVDAIVGLGFCHLDQERFAAAISFFKRALAASPTHGEALIGMGEAYKVQGNYAKALDYYRAYLQSNPGGRKAVLARRNVTDLERRVAGASPAPAPSPSPSPSPAPAPAPESPPAPTSPPEGANP